MQGQPPVKKRPTRTAVGNDQLSYVELSYAGSAVISAIDPGLWPCRNNPCSSDLHAKLGGAPVEFIDNAEVLYNGLRHQRKKERKKDLFVLKDADASADA